MKNTLIGILIGIAVISLMAAVGYGIYNSFSNMNKGPFDRDMENLKKAEEQCGKRGYYVAGSNFEGARLFLCNVR